MSCRDWLQYAAVGIGLAAVLLGLAFSLERYIDDFNQPHSSYRAADEDCAGAPHKVRDALVFPVCSIPTPIPEPKPERDEWRNEQDLVAQNRMAFWSVVVAVASVVSAFATIVGIFLVKQTLDANRAAVLQAAHGTEAARAAVLVAKMTAERQLRAYLGISPLERRIAKAGEYPRVRFKIHNAGQTPALRAVNLSSVFVFPHPIPHNHPFPKFARTDYLELTISPAPPSNGVATAYKPITADDLANIENGTHRLYLCGVLIYRDVFDKEHETKFFFDVLDDPSGTKDPVDSGWMNVRFEPRTEHNKTS